MKMNSNLCKAPWIPVMMSDGSSDWLSLEEAFAQAERIRDLALSPKERISLMRLLICITQRAIDGPENVGEWENLCLSDIQRRALEYLRQWEPAFALCGEDGGFLQVPGLAPRNGEKDKDLSPFSKLDLALASGNNSTLFDNEGGCERKFSFSRQALNLLTFQNFTPDRIIGVAQWADSPTAAKSPDSGCPAAPCVGPLHLFLLGANLLETVWMNLTPKSELPPARPWGKPVWEQMPRSQTDKEAVENAVHSHLGRLVPISRCIRLMDHGILLARGLDYSAYTDKTLLYWEPSTRRRRSSQGNKIILVRADLETAIWRSLPSMIQGIQDGNSKDFSPFCNERLPQEFDIWVGGLVVDKAKILGEMESRFARMSIADCDAGALNNLRHSLETAKKQKQRLCGALIRYNEIMSAPIEKSKKPNPIHSAKSLYWGELSSEQHLFLKTAKGNEDESWEKRCRRACRRAYDAMCPHSTNRQMEAWIRAWVNFTSPSS